MTLWQRFFGKSDEFTEISAPAAAPHDWSLLGDTDATCTCCGKSFATLTSIAFPAPGIWQGDPTPLPNSEFLIANGDILTEDFCRCQGHLFVRAILELPMIGLDQSFLIGVWGTLSEENFAQFQDTFDQGTQGKLELMFSWMSNPVPANGKVPVACVLRGLDGRMRPRLFLTDETHPFYPLQIDGIDQQDLIEILRAFGHDFATGRNRP